MRRVTRRNLDDLQLSDIYSLMLFLLYKIDDVPEYATLSELCYLLDGNNLIRLITYFAGKTITIPSEEDFTILINALLLYQYVNIDDMPFATGTEKLQNLTFKQKEDVIALYLKIIPIIKEYNIDRSQIQKDAR